RRLDYGRVRAAGRTERTEVHRARRDGQQNESRKEKILPHRIGNERRAILFGQFMVFAYVGRAFHNASRHGPFVDSKLYDHQEMKGHEADQHSRNYEDLQRKESGNSGTSNKWP